jgi:hypothetical protein
MTDKAASTTETVLQELLAAINANTPVASGFGPCSANPSFVGDWEVWDRDCVERVRTAAAALKELLQGKPTEPQEGLQELLAAIDANIPFAAGTGHCPAVPCFDRHDREAERARPGWEVVDRKCADRIRRSAAALVKR